MKKTDEHKEIKSLLEDYIKGAKSAKIGAKRDEAWSECIQIETEINAYEHLLDVVKGMRGEDNE